MPKVNWMYLCDYAYKDVTGKTSIIGMFNNINVLRLPNKYQQIFTIMEVEKLARENCKLEVIITSPSGEEITKKVGREIGAQGTTTQVMKITLIYAFYGIPLKEPGEYHALLFLDGECIHSIPFRVRVLKLKRKSEEAAVE